jgi:hypothetical protein
MEQDELLHRVVDTLERLAVPYLVTGSIATIFYGEPRFTNDIGVVAQLEPRHLPYLLAEFPAEEFFLSSESALRAIAQRRQFNVIHPGSGLQVDLIVPAMDAFDESRFSRGRRVHPAPDYAATFASPEDVIVKKLQYFAAGRSEKHLRDAAGVLKITPETDRAYIAAWAERLGVADVWQQVERLAE